MRSRLRFRSNRGLIFVSLFTILSLVTASSGNASSLICRESGIVGLDSYAARAHQYLGDTTHDPSKIVVHISSPEPNALYLHSNFLSTDAENPTKIFIKDEEVDLETIAYNIVHWTDKDPGADTFTSEVFPKIKFIIDRKVLANAENYRWLQWGSTDRLYVADGPGTTHKVQTLSASDRPEFIEQIEGTLYRRVKDDNRASLSDLQNIPFSESDVKVLPLVMNTATLEAIKTKLHSENILPLDINTSVGDLFRSRRGKTLILLGHIESGAFVTKDARGKEIYRLPLEDARAEATANRVTLVTLGCNSAAHANLGVTKEFNTLDAVDRLAQAFNANNFKDFFHQLSSDELPLVIDRQAIYVEPTPGTTREQSTRHEVEVTVFNQGLEKEVGKISVTSTQTSVISSIPPQFNTSDLASLLRNDSGVSHDDPDDGFPWGVTLLVVLGGSLGFWHIARNWRNG